MQNLLHNNDARYHQPLRPSAELQRAYDQAEAAHFAKMAKGAKKETPPNRNLLDGFSAGLWAKLLAALIFAAVFVWLVATAIAKLPVL